jgi:UDP-N-acetylglucosamine--N-acetylmuramyl-(pentapeptide) pyrophosphoryl-undecaprenol N-acetylglucosamine transferase
VITPSTFVMAGGGSGGHVIPALAVARELRARGHSVRFIGVRRGMEAKLVPAEDFPIEWIEIGGLKRVGPRKLIETLARLPWSVWQASRMLRRAAPAAVFSTGGYVAGPVLVAAIRNRIPVVVMEPNAVPGFTHRRLARFAARAFVSFPETARWFPKNRVEVAGLPVREEFFTIPSAEPPAPPGKPFTVLITGGSQGSQTLNRAAEQSWPLLDHRSVSLIHQTGAAAFAELAPRFRASGVSGEIHPFLDNVAAAFAPAHLVVSRSGMGAVSELAAAGRPSILVPLPTASDHHQLRNAEALERAGAALLIPDREMTGARLAQEIARLAAEPARLEAMARAARTFARPGAARRVAEILESLAGGRAG